jgi:hypothetical protein
VWFRVIAMGTPYARAHAMRFGLAVVMVMFAVHTAAAEPILVGAEVGAIHDPGQSDGSTLGAFVRMRLDRRAWAELDLARVSLDQGGPSLRATPGSSDVTQTGGSLLADLGDGGVVPVVIAGVGLDFASNIVRDNTYLHGEVGAGLELRAGAVVFGVDVRLGTRTIVEQTKRDVLVYYEPRVLAEGTYTTGHVRLGVRF